MDDIYDQLENYNEVNSLQELRTENEDLKQKLEECSTAMGKLQKHILQDYDHLASEFNKLEMNYSSLLKTARAEIERKTQTITNLNIEKDMLVIKAMQNGNNIRRHFYKDKQNFIKSNNNTCNKDDNNKQVKVKEESQKTKDIDATADRKEKCGLQSKAPVTNTPVDNAKKNTSNVGPTNTSIAKKSEFKENSKQESKVGPKIVASSIRTRRKSMPAVCAQEKFSSDDEYDNRPISKEKIRTDILPYDKPERKFLDKVYTDRHSNKTSETSSIDERNSNYQEPSREVYRTKPGNNFSNEKYRGRDKYESSQRYRKHSPDRGHRRSAREYHDDYQYRPEHGRRRVHLSPPPGAYHNSQSNYNQRRSREHRPNYDSRYDRHESERYRNRYEEKQSFKHKTLYDYEEPTVKRQRIESSSNLNYSYPDEEMRYRNETDIVERAPIRGLNEFDINHTSCQSPDYTHAEAVAGHSIKEIRNTAAIPLEDPRKFSKKYVLKADAEGETTISTVTGRNVDIIPIDKSVWNIERVSVPQALKSLPSQYTEEIVSEIYMDIDKPVLDISLESGEICFDSEELYSGNYDKNPRSHSKDTDKDTVKDTVEIDKRNSDQGTCEKRSKVSQPIPNIEIVQTANLTEYKIPKIKRDKNVEESVRCVKLETDKGVYKPNDEHSSKLCNKNDNHIQKTVLGRLIDTHDILHSNKENEINEILSASKKESPSQLALSARIMVEGDLELSDETSDVAEPSTQTSKENINVQTKEKDTVTEVKLKAPSEKEIEIAQPPDGNDTKINDQEVIGLPEEPKESEIKKQKGKKKKSKTKDTENPEVVQVSDKKKRAKKEKENPKEIKKKFSDLFGDSGSLITPEDLGIATYVPMFEDAQDAVDLNIKPIVENTPPKVNDEICNGLKFETGSVVDSKPIAKQNLSEINVSSECVQEVITDNKTKISLKGDDDKVSSEIIPNVVYESLNPEPSVSADVVKTVIISTGVQPQFVESKVGAILDNPLVKSDPITNISGVNQNVALKEIKGREHIKALATSTPQKEFVAMKLTDSEHREIETTRNTVLIRTESIDSIPSAVDQCETNTLDSRNETDAPDVRIFVKRRRRVIKKPPV